MNQTLNRRSFLRTTSAMGAGLSWIGLHGPRLAAADAIELATPSAEKLGWQLSAAQYTFRRFALFDTLELVASLGIRSVEPGYFLKLDQDRPKLTVNESLSADNRKELKARLADCGIGMPSFYSNVGESLDGCRKIFDFAKEMGVKTLVAEPPAEAFDTIENLCLEYKINLAIHNHPKGPNSKYWKPENSLAACKNRGQRIGVCCDTGHWVRSGLEPVECLKKLEGRIISLHLKDVIEWDKPAARDVPLGTGKANYMAVMKEIERQQFRGLMAIEYEHDSPKLMDEVGQCVAFVEKMAKTL
jgi:sugar phosphate isomerase/epimerase